MNRTRFERHRLHRQSGIGMIEILITLLVISFGFLGIAALQARALSTNNSATARSNAVIATYSILDAMRADVVNAKDGLYNGTVYADQCPSAGSDLPSTQRSSWCDRLGAALGTADSTTGKIDCSSVGDCTVTIQFDDSRAGTDSGSSSVQQVVTKARL